MAWITPKTDWYGYTDTETGTYIGDHFNCTDFNRMKNNLIELKDLLNQVVFPQVTLRDISDKHTYDFLYDYDLNYLSENFLRVYEAFGYPRESVVLPTFVPNGPTMDYLYLNLIESLCAYMYEYIPNWVNGRSQLTFVLGINDGMPGIMNMEG